jgi:hypothetical protein
MNNDEMFIDDVGRIWINGSIVKVDLLTKHASQDKVTRQMVCRLVIPVSDATKIFGGILAAIRQYNTKNGSDDHLEASQPAIESAAEERIIFSVPKIVSS